MPGIMWSLISPLSRVLITIVYAAGTQVLEIRVEGFGIRVEGCSLGFRVWGLGRQSLISRALWLRLVSWVRWGGGGGGRIPKP